MPNFNSPTRVAVIGAGLAGVACAASLQRGGLQVTLFDKSRGVSGRMATRRARWVGADGREQAAEFDHGAQHFTARHPRFRATVARARAAGVVVPWRSRLHAGFALGVDLDTFVPTPGMPALCHHLAAGVPLRTEQPVQRLQRNAEGWWLVVASGATVGPFDQVMLALPAAQAAVLLAGHHDAWADALAAVPMHACWTLMAATDEVDWPWDATEPTRGALAWVLRNDRKPGRTAPPGVATWVAHATVAWSADHLEAEPTAVAETLSAALAALLPAGHGLRWHHRSVHRWRYAVPAERVSDADECWWDPALGLGVCGDVFGGGQVEAAWRSGDELADTVLCGLEAEADVVPTPAAAEIL
jgi:renalase